MRPGHAEDRRRVGRHLSGRAVGIVFAGGGARGASHLGAIRALAEAGVEFDIVGGTSIGAAVAAWYAMGLRDEALKAAAFKVFVDSGGPTSDWNLLPLLSLVKGKRTRDLGIESIRDATGGDIDIEDTWVPFFCVAANYTAQEEAVLQHGPLWRGLLASYAIPGVLPPVLIGGELHVDGGVMNNLPVDVLEREGAAATIAIDLLGHRKRSLDFDELPGTLALLRDKFRPRRKRRYRIPGILSVLFNSTVLSSLQRQREMAARASLCLTPDLPRTSLLDWAKFPETIENGYKSVKATLADLPPERLEALRARKG
jgi:NTE family protein